MNKCTLSGLSRRTIRTMVLLFSAFLVLLRGPGLLAQDSAHPDMTPDETTTANPGNPVFPGWYADPEGHIFGKEYWVYPTYSAPYDEQTHMDAFSSPDLVHWTKHSNIIDKTIIPWAKRALWAPSMTVKDGKYYFFFAANDIHQPGTPGGIGIAVGDQPGGPFKDYLGKPLVNTFYHGAQPIDPDAFRDVDGQYYLIYGGWGHCVIGKLNADFTGFVPLPDGEMFKEITPKGYVEGPFMIVRKGKYYFMWSQGAWTNSTYNIAYAIGDSPLGPFKNMGTVIQPDPSIATGAGHHSVIQLPGDDSWFIVYHRRPPGETDGNHRVVAIDRMFFNPDGSIKPVIMTNEGVGATTIDSAPTR